MRDPVEAAQRFMLSPATEEEADECFEMSSRMMETVEVSDENRKLLFGATGLITQFIFDTRYDTPEEKVKAFDEWALNIRMALQPKPLN